MPTLNRFPLLGLWAEEAAHRIGYRREEAESLGHAYAVFYAIRKNRLEHPAAKPEKPAAAERRKGEHLRFGGDDLEVTYDEDGKMRGRVGGDKPQTPASYRASIVKKFPPGYYDKLKEAFGRLLKAYKPSVLDSRVIYNLYDEWKKACAVGRLVDLDELLKWCRERTEAGSAAPRSRRRAASPSPRKPAGS
jgi:hypothetical protein